MIGENINKQYTYYAYEDEWVNMTLLHIAALVRELTVNVKNL